MTQNLVDINTLSALLTDSRRVVVAVSGGADSMALLYQISQYREILNKDFMVLHVDHQINKDSKSWGVLVKNYAHSLNFPCKIVEVDLSGYGNNLEQAARSARYRALVSQDCDTIMLAHHANDQIETFFLKLFRGSGIKALAGMSKSADCWADCNKLVVRPLLSVARTAIEQYVSDHDIPFVTDPSNSDTSYDRNWIRHCLFPIINNRNSVSAYNVLKSMANIDEAATLVQDLAKIDLDRCTNADGSLDWASLKQLSAVRLKNLVIYLCNLHNCNDLKSSQIEMFVNGLYTASMDSKNEMKLDKVRFHKVGKRVFVDLT